MFEDGGTRGKGLQVGAWLSLTRLKEIYVQVGVPCMAASTNGKIVNHFGCQRRTKETLDVMAHPYLFQQNLTFS